MELNARLVTMKERFVPFLPVVLLIVPRILLAVNHLQRPIDLHIDIRETRNRDLRRLTSSRLSLPQFSKFIFSASKRTVNKLHIAMVKLSMETIPSKPPQTAHVSTTKLISCQGDVVVLKGYLALIGRPSSIGVKNNKANARKNPNAINP